MQNLCHKISYMARNLAMSFLASNGLKSILWFIKINEAKSSCSGAEQIPPEAVELWFGDYSLDLDYLNSNPNYNLPAM